MPPTTPYHRHPQRGGGRQRIFITSGNGNQIELVTLNERLLAAKIIQAHLLLGASREEAEAVAAEEVIARRKARKWFGR